MAERRMFAKTIIDSDAFLDMSVTARLLYYDLSMRADDDGFVNSPKKIMRMVGAAEDDLRMLAARKFIIPFESGIVVIKHWRIHNYIRKDTYNSTPYNEERAMLELDENNAYRLVDGMYTERGRAVDESATQVRLGKDRLDKVNKDKAPDEPVVYFPDNQKLNEAFEKYIAHRKKLKKPMDDYKKELAINKLKSLSDGDEEIMIAIIEQSIREGWQGLFELKSQPKASVKNKFSDFKQSDTDLDELAKRIFIN